MTDSEIKLLKAKCALLGEIDTAKAQIDYHITDGARKTRELLQSAKDQKTDTTSLTKEQHEAILNYLLSVERKSMQNYGTSNGYLSGYYLTIEIKTEVLSKL